MTLAIKVKVTKPQPKIGTCRIFLLHDDLTEATRGHGRRQGHRIPPRSQHEPVSGDEVTPPQRVFNRLDDTIHVYSLCPFRVGPPSSSQSRRIAASLERNEARSQIRTAVSF